jgi:predicted nicotinamide N-methyase
VRGRTAFDFASGSALVGIAACLAGAGRVVASDIDPFACTAARMNAELAGVILEPSAVDRVGDPLDGFDVVLAGDVFYDQSAAARFDPWFRALDEAGKLVLVGDPGRAYFPGGLTALRTYDVPVPFDLESAETKPATVYRYPVTRLASGA